ncbi:Site-specific recombinase XerD [Archaeoglobus sulfaticallidus PM70-1]|uniref:Site-specific recombinase XerD n=1 Tax=Archaeoglobus sulfaticallidus PM70-1 TaxID=387631 RepID=N0BEG4_9EURY|nr:site-specific integrase [Archaeoglobus sulfaticallidus]AGK61403.1 Site-specific recombinase XerD [Archaeoglobus sulfaticallidus PM70-1]
MDRGKYAHLLKDPDLKRWYMNLSRGSEVTADVNLRRLGRFCEIMGVKPNKLLNMDDRSLKNLILDFIGIMEKEKYAGSYIYSFIKSVKSWLRFNDRELRVNIKIRDSHEHPNTFNERVPTQKELKSVLLSGDKRARVACSLIAFSGLRIQVLGNYRGIDGLKVMDFPEMTVSNGEVEFEVVPTMVVVRPAISKVGHQYFTFLGEEGCTYLKEYLEERMRMGEKMDRNSPIITPRAASFRGRHISTINIGDIIRQAIRRAGFDWRPYVLRHYFDTQLLLAESKGLVIRDYRVFWMGHKGDIEHQYTTNRNRLPEDLVEDMRESYARASVYLETEMTSSFNSAADKLRYEYRRTMLMIAGVSEEDIESMDLASMSEEEFIQFFREKMLDGEQNDGQNGGQNSQRVVDIDEAENLINSGWEFVATLPNGKIVVKRG